MPKKVPKIIMSLLMKFGKDLLKGMVQEQVKKFQAPAFEEKMAKSIADKIPDTEAFPNELQIALIRDVVDHITDELAESVDLEAD
tara:strand:+ start:154 stop:408 length:255 start_codon:yes stop_codon:yes gene_type:complete